MNNIRSFCHFNIRNNTWILTRQIMTSKVAAEGVWLTQLQDHTVKWHSDMNFFNIAVVNSILISINTAMTAHHSQYQAEHRCYQADNTDCFLKMVFHIRFFL